MNSKSELVKNPLLIRFDMRLENQEIMEYIRPHGPLFHRWLPDGKNDAIQVNLGNKGSKLLIYFERLGVIQNQMIKYELKKLENGEATIARQACLDAGPLFGELEYYEYSNEEIEAVIKDAEGNEHYVSLAKQVTRLVVPYFQSLLNSLKYIYGQYWIPELKMFDSRQFSIGNYCAGYLGMRWKYDKSKDWIDFKPDVNAIRFDAGIRTETQFEQYLEKKDWESIANSFSSEFDPSLPGIFLLKAHKAFEANNISQGLIEGATALELAIDEYINRQVAGNKLLSDALNSFRELGLTAKAGAVLSIHEGITNQIAESAIKAVQERNRVVHDGHQPNEIQFEIKDALLKCTAVLLKTEGLKFPEVNIGNRLYGVNPGNTAP
jgi:hypothetical protein